jgi:hypothetical protein
MVSKEYSPKTIEAYLYYNRNSLEVKSLLDTLNLKKGDGR